jgi:hypothetical protein
MKVFISIIENCFDIPDISDVVNLIAESIPERIEIDEDSKKLMF